MRIRSLPGRPNASRAWGTWLSFLAIFVQAWLPLIVAAELYTLEPGRDGIGLAAICHAIVGSADETGNSSQTPASGDSHSLECCPLCVVLSAGAAFITPEAPALPTVEARRETPREAREFPHIARDTAFAHQARAPPLNA